MPSLATDSSAQPAGFCGIWGLPYVDLAPLFDTTPLARIDEEICLGLTRVATSYTGGSLKWMNVVAPHVQEDGYVDYMHVIEGFSREEFAALRLPLPTRRATSISTAGATTPSATRRITR